MVIDSSILEIKSASYIFQKVPLLSFVKIALKEPTLMDQEPLKTNCCNGGDSAGTDLESAVLARYGEASREVDACLCLPVNYDRALLGVIPGEIIEKDYGCGDPSRYVHQGETVLDLGSGSGKACYIISQIVGASG